jgi:hypothetical protein
MAKSGMGGAIFSVMFFAYLQRRAVSLHSADTVHGPVGSLTECGKVGTL